MSGFLGWRRRVRADERNRRAEVATERVREREKGRGWIQSESGGGHESPLPCYCSDLSPRRIIRSLKSTIPPIRRRRSAFFSTFAPFYSSTSCDHRSWPADFSMSVLFARLQWDSEIAPAVITRREQCWKWTDSMFCYLNLQIYNYLVRIIIFMNNIHIIKG